MKPRRRRIKVYATGAHRGALEQPRKCKNKPLFFASAASSISNEPLSPLSLPSLKKKGFRHGLLATVFGTAGAFSFIQPSFTSTFHSNLRPALIALSIFISMNRLALVAQVAQPVYKQIKTQK